MYTESEYIDKLKSKDLFIYGNHICEFVKMIDSGPKSELFPKHIQDEDLSIEIEEFQRIESQINHVIEKSDEDWEVGELIHSLVFNQYSNPNVCIIRVIEHGNSMIHPHGKNIIVPHGKIVNKILL